MWFAIHSPHAALYNSECDGHETPPQTQARQVPCTDYTIHAKLSCSALTRARQPKGAEEWRGRRHPNWGTGKRSRGEGGTRNGLQGCIVQHEAVSRSQGTWHQSWQRGLAGRPTNKKLVMNTAHCPSDCSYCWRTSSKGRAWTAGPTMNRRVIRTQNEFENIMISVAWIDLAQSALRMIGRSELE